VRCFFVSPDRVFEDTLILDREDCRHIRDVLRMPAGEHLRVSDGSDFVYRVRITAYPDESVLCSILEKESLPTGRTPRLTLMQSIPKGKRMEWLVQKSTEIGVHEIIPIVMDRSVRLVHPDKAGRWTRRMLRIAEEAAKQCGRFDLPRMKEPLRFREALERVEAFPLRIFFEPGGKGASLVRIHEKYPHPDGIVLLVGPEGGITAEEAALLSAQGFLSASLGEPVLRVETAGILSAALVRYEWVDRNKEDNAPSGRMRP